MPLHAPILNKIQESGRDNVLFANATEHDCLRIQNGAFSLIELLVVMAIIGLLAGFAIPAFNSIGQARGVTEAAYQLASSIELARSEAVSRQTFVWLGMQNQTNAGGLDLRLGLVYSKDGSSTNTFPNNLQPIGRSLLIQRVGLTAATTGDVGTNLGTLVDLAAFSGGLKPFKIGQTDFSDGRTVTFTPLGEVTTNPSPDSTNGFDPRLAVVLCQARGTALNTNSAIAVVIDGSVGVPTIYQK